MLTLLTNIRLSKVLWSPSNYNLFYHMTFRAPGMVRGPESEKRSNLPRNRLPQIQTFLTIMVIFGQNRHDFDCQNQQRRGKGGVSPIQKTSGGEGESEIHKNIYLLSPSQFFLLNHCLLYMNTWHV